MTYCGQNYIAWQKIKVTGFLKSWRQFCPQFPEQKKQIRWDKEILNHSFKLQTSSPGLTAIHRNVGLSLFAHGKFETHACKVSLDRKPLSYSQCLEEVCSAWLCSYRCLLLGTAVCQHAPCGSAYTAATACTDTAMRKQRQEAVLVVMAGLTPSVLCGI